MENVFLVLKINCLINNIINRKKDYNMYKEYFKYVIEHKKNVFLE